MEVTMERPQRPKLQVVEEVRPAEERQVWEVPDVCTYLGMKKTWVYEAARKGTLPCKRLGSRLKFDADEVRAWWARQGRAQ